MTLGMMWLTKGQAAPLPSPAQARPAPKPPPAQTMPAAATAAAPKVMGVMSGVMMRGRKRTSQRRATGTWICDSSRTVCRGEAEEGTPVIKKLRQPPWARWGTKEKSKGRKAMQMGTLPM